MNFNVNKRFAVNNFKIAGILAIVLLLGFIYLLMFPKQKLSPDAIEYDTLGWNLTQGNGYRIESDTLDVTREPFYPFFLSIIYFIFGHSYLAVRVIQIIVNGLTCVFIYLIGKETLGERIGLMSSLMAAICPAFIAYTGYILTETLFTFLLIVAVFLLIKTQKDGFLIWHILSGFVLGLAILCKAALIIFPIFVSIAMLVIFKPKKKVLASMFFLIFISVVTITPWVIRNYRVFGNIIPVRTSAGFNLWWGSYLPWNGENISGKDGYPEVRIKYIATEPLKSLVSGLSPIEADKVLIKESIKNIQNNPLGYIGLSLKRIIKLWIPPIGEMLIRERNIYLANMLVICHYLLLFFSLVGIILSIVKLKTSYLATPMILVIVYFTAIYSLTYAHPRYHLPILPYIIIFANLGFLYIVKIFSIERIRLIFWRKRW